MSCRDCMHFKACGQWYPEEKLIRDECYKNCKHFDEERGDEYDTQKSN